MGGGQSKRAEEERTEGASTSSISSAATGVGSGQYDVFLSFKGSDTRKEFTDHLYHSLVKAGIVLMYTFKDDESIPIGEEFGSQIIDAITRSKISIPIISENYASSKWCLCELIHIMDRKKSSSHIVLPIFYKVTPSNVRHLTGNFGDAFRLRLRQGRFDEKIVQEGLEALREVSDLHGWEFTKVANWHEGELIQLVVKAVLSNLPKNFELDIPRLLVGLDGCLMEIMNWIRVPSVNARMIGIYGMAGIGKTTLAKCIYNQLLDEFEHTGFLPNIREKATHHGGMEDLQSQLISDILRHTIKVSRVDDGIDIIKSRFKRKRVLILLDDIDDQYQLDKLVGERDWLMAGSMIIVTTRNEAVLVQSKFEVDYKYEMKGLNEVQSLLLFNRNAFHMDHSPQDFESISRDIISTMDGIPLALEIVGSYLYEKTNKKVWKDVWRQLKGQPHKDVKRILHISYDALEDRQKQIFLDIACFFIGESFDSLGTYMMCMWEDFGLYPSLEIEELKLRRLIKIGDGGEFEMHDQLKDLGRNMIQQERLSGARSRLWLYKDVSQVPRGGKMDHLKYLQRPRFDDSMRAASSGDENLSEVRWLRWRVDESDSSLLPANLCLPKLVVLDLAKSDVTEDWEEWSSLRASTRLRALNLTWCSNLRSTPDLSAFPWLKILNLYGCSRLEHLHPSIGKLKSLVSLDLRYCICLKELPEEVGGLEDLEELDLSKSGIRQIPSSIRSLGKLKKLVVVGYKYLIGIPSSIGNLQNLQHLDISHSRIEELPRAIGRLKNLQTLNISGAPIFDLPESILKLYCLQRLYLGGCKRLKELPEKVGELKELEELTLDDSGIVKIPESIGSMWKLKRLSANRCKSLREIPSSIGNLENLQHLDISYSKIKELPSAIGRLINLQTLNISGAPIFDLPESILKLYCLQRLYLGGCKSLKELPEKVGELKELEELTLDDSGIVEIPKSIGSLRKLKRLSANRCKSLREIPSSIGDLQNLQQLDISHSAIEWLPSLRGKNPSEIGDLSLLKVLNLACCNYLRYIPDLSALKGLEILILKHCDGLEQVHPSVGKLKSLVSLDLSDCGSLKELPEELDELKELKQLILDSTGITAIPTSIGSLRKLEKLSAYFCRSLRQIPHSIGNLQNLQDLDISHSAIEKLPVAIGRLKKLQRLNLKFCYLLKGGFLNEVGDLSSLEILDISGTGIVNVPNSISNISSLRCLSLWGCYELKSLPELPSGLTNLSVSFQSPTLPQLSCLVHLVELDLYKCVLLEYIPELPLRLRKLCVVSCHKLKLLKLRASWYLKELSIKNCGSIERLDLSMLDRLKCLHAEDCNNLVQIQYGNLESLKEVVIDCCKSIERLIFPGLWRLKQLKAKYCDNLVEIQGLDEAESLEVLDISYGECIERLPDLSCFWALKELNINGCCNLRGVEGLERFSFCRRIYITGCLSLEKLPDLSKFKELEKFTVRYSLGVTEIPGIDKSRYLTHIDITGCKSMEILPDLSGCNMLRSLVVRDCKKLTHLQGHEKLHLTYLDISGCDSLKTIPKLPETSVFRNYERPQDEVPDGNIILR